MKKNLTPASEYLAVDVHVRSRRSLADLLKSWPDAQTPTRTGTEAPRWLVVNVVAGTLPKNADQAARAFVRSIDRLPAAARRCWSQASSRTFDIGIQAGLTPSCFEEVVLSAETLKAIARVGGRVQITLYAPRRE